MHLIALAFIAWLKNNLRTSIRNSLCRKATIAVVLFFQINICPAGDTTKIILLLSGSAQVYQTVAFDTIRDIKKKCSDNLPICTDINFESINIDQETSTTIKDALMMIVFGTKAANNPIATGFGRQMIISMIPKQSRLLRNDKPTTQSITKIFIDQPFERYLALIKTVAPRASRVGLLLHASDEYLRESMIAAAEKANLSLIVGIVDSNDDIGESLSHMLGSIDILLALPDARIHNSNTISNILTTSYRNHIPVIGFSSAYVKAGATAAIYTSLKDISEQVSDVVIQLLRNDGTIPQLMSSEYFSVSFNFDVARSLGLTLRSPSEIKETMQEGMAK